MSDAMEQEFQEAHKEFLVWSGEVKSESVMRDREGRIIGLTVAIQGEGEFIIPLYVNGEISKSVAGEYGTGTDD